MKFSFISAYSFGCSKRSITELKSPEFNNKNNFPPGPGYYNGEYIAIKSKSPGWKLINL